MARNPRARYARMLSPPCATLSPAPFSSTLVFVQVACARPSGKFTNDDRSYAGSYYVPQCVDLHMGFLKPFF